MKRILAILLLLFAGKVSAAVLTEDFETPFPEWENGWLGTNSNLQNFYGIGQGRGNNPDGLWIDDGDGQFVNDTVEIVFDQLFGSSLLAFEIDVATYIDGLSLQVFDIFGTSIFNSDVSPTRGAMVDPGIYETFSVDSSNGISGFTMIANGRQIEGNTGIDNVSVTTVNVPEPSTIMLLVTGVLGLAFARRRRRGQLKWKSVSVQMSRVRIS